MANTILTASVIAQEALLQLENNCQALQMCYRGYEKEYASKVNGYKKGATISISAPIQSRSHDGPNTSAVDVIENYVDLTVDTHKMIDHSVTALDLTQKIGDFSRLFVTPNMITLADDVDRAVLGAYIYSPNQVGTPGSAITSMSTFDLAHAVLDRHAIPRSQRYCMVDPTTHAAMAHELRSFTNDKIAGMAIRGKVADGWGGFENLYMSQNAPRHTPGTWAGQAGVAIDTAPTSGGTTLTLDAPSGLTVAAGDIFTVADVLSVNPINGSVYAQARQFVDPTGGTFSGGGFDLTVTNPLGTERYKTIDSTAAASLLPYQTMNTLPVDDAALTIPGSASTTYGLNLCLHKNAIALAMVPLERLGAGVDESVATRNGVSVKVTIGSTFSSHTKQIRFDILFGIKVLNPFGICRVAC